MREQKAGRLALDLGPLAASGARWHGHCHQKAFGVESAVQQALDLVPQLEARAIEAGCCGMAGAFGYEAEHFDISMKMAEADLLPAVRDTDDDALLIADGFSCRLQILDGTILDDTEGAMFFAEGDYLRLTAHFSPQHFLFVVPSTFLPAFVTAKSVLDYPEFLRKIQMR